MIAAMLRVKNESRWIAEVVDALRPCCEPIVVMDDGSADNTAEICRDHGCIVYPSPFRGIDEARDKDWLLKKLETHVPSGTWVLCIDGDEVLEPGGAGKVQDAAAVNGADAYLFKILYLWDDRQHVRTDGVYGRFSRPSMFRIRPGLTFKRTGAHANFHCSSVPAEYIGRCAESDINLLHLGYMDKADRIRKYQWYRAKDGLNSAEDGYRHIVIGDLFPAHSVFRHAGPLKVEALP